jgi:hypothetical protein
VARAAAQYEEVLGQGSFKTVYAPAAACGARRGDARARRVVLFGLQGTH